MDAPTILFSPKGGCQQQIVKLINAATSVIRMQAYTFTAEPIAAALIAAKARGIDVQICQDAKAWQEKGNVGQQCLAAGIPVFLDALHPIAHSKTLMIDDLVVATGSYNYSNEAEENLENLVTISDEAIAGLYAANWLAHYAHCTPAT